MKASIIAVAAIVLVSVGAYFAVASVNTNQQSAAATNRAEKSAPQSVASATLSKNAAKPAPVASQVNTGSKSHFDLSRSDRANDFLAAAAATRAAATQAKVDSPTAAPAAAATQTGAITVVRNGQTILYPKGSVLAVSATEDTTVNYNGVKVFIPKGQQVTVREGANGAVIISGNDMQGVQINDQTIRSTGATVLAASADSQQVEVTRGTAQITANGQTKQVSAPAAQQAQQTAAKAQTKTAATTTTNTSAGETVEVPAFVSADIVTNPAQEQAVQDVVEEEERELSPSTPR